MTLAHVVAARNTRTATAEINNTPLHFLINTYPLLSGFFCTFAVSIHQIFIIMAILFYMLFALSLFFGIIICLQSSVVYGLATIVSGLTFLFMGGVLSYLKRIADKIDPQDSKAPIGQKEIKM